MLGLFFIVTTFVWILYQVVTKGIFHSRITAIIVSGTTMIPHMKNHILTKVFIIFSLTFLSSNLVAQEFLEGYDYAVNPKGGWYNFGLDDEGKVFGVELNIVNQNDIIYSIDYYNFEEYYLYGDLPSEYFHQVGLMIGKRIGQDYFRMQYQGGIAMFSGMMRSDELIQEGSGFNNPDVWGEDKFTTVGLIGKIGCKIVPFKFMSLGFDLQANLNTQKVVYMPIFSVEIGRLK